MAASQDRSVFARSHTPRPYRLRESALQLPSFLVLFFREGDRRHRSDSRRKSLSGPWKTGRFCLEPTRMYSRRPRKRLAARVAMLSHSMLWQLSLLHVCRT